MPTRKPRKRQKVNRINSEAAISATEFYGYLANPFYGHASHPFINHIVVTPDLPMLFRKDSYPEPKLIRKFEETGEPVKYKVHRTRAVKKPACAPRLESCGCNLNCCDQINEHIRIELFNEFWNLRDRQNQRDYLVDRVKFQEPKKSLVNESRKKYTLTYVLIHGDREYPVCRKFFLNTLNVTEKVVRYALLNKDRDLHLKLPEEATFCSTPRGGTVIVYEGFRFSRHHVTDAQTRWHCATHKGKGCRAYLYTVDTQIIRCNNDHNHNLPKNL